MRSLLRRGRFTVLLVFAAMLACAVAASAQTITTPTTGAPTTGSDYPTRGTADNSAWAPAPTGYIAPSNDGLGVSSGKIGHVWVIVLENHSFQANFTPLEGTQNSYEASLPSQGALLTNYYGTGHSSLDNYLSMVSGQAPQADDQDDCPSYDAMTGSVDTSGTPSSNADYGQFASSAGPDAPPYDNGCVYPSSVQTVFNQLDSANKTWKVYAQDLEDSGTNTAGVSTNTDGHNAGTNYCGAPDTTVGTAPTAGATTGTYRGQPVERGWRATSTSPSTTRCRGSSRC